MTLRMIHFDTLLALCQHSSEAVIALDEQAHISLLNPVAEAAFDVQSADATGKPPADIPELAPLLPFIERAHADYTATRERVTLPDGRIVWVQIVQTQPATEAAAEKLPRITNKMGEIVHDMKRPLSSTKSYIDLIAEAGPLSSVQEQFAKKARLGLVAMLNQFHQLEDMAWIDSNGHLQISPVEMTEVIRRALTHLEGFARQQNVTITIDIDQSTCELEGDAHRLESVFGNLIHNAIKYSPHGGEVRITSHTGNGHIAFEVHDNGIGIPQEHIPYLFDQFYRVRTADTARIEGSGMGLAIVRTIVKKHGGDVFVKSDPGEGSTFGFWLPCTGT